MRFATRPTNGPAGIRDRSRAGFTLAEVLAALLFMAIVIPVAVQGLRVASLAGVVAERKCQAARVAERILNECIVTTNWTKSLQNGTLFEGPRQFRWTLRSEPWNQHMTNQPSFGQVGMNLLSVGQGTLNLLSVEVVYAVQNQDYLVRLTTLASTPQ